MSKYTWTDDMREISGFGGSYEAACRAMVTAGLEWFDANPTAEPKFHGFKGIAGIITEDNPDAKALTKAVMNAIITGDDGKPMRVGDDCTGAMHQFSIGHCLQAHKIGWEKYSALMRAARKEKPK